MKLVLLWLALLPFAATASAGDSRSARVPTDLILAETLGTHRVLVFQVCSPEHCWNDFFIQELDQEKVVCSAPITEFNSSADVIVEFVRRRPAGTLSDLGLELQSSHGAFAPYTATLSLKSGCKYQLHPAAPAAS